MSRTLFTSWLGLLTLLVLCIHSEPICAQGVLLVSDYPRPIPLPRPILPPLPPSSALSYKIKELSVEAQIQDQVAKVQLTQTFVNTGSAAMEVSLCFPLPYDGAIDQMTFLVDGKEYEGKLLSSKQAREIYEGYVRRNQDPALLEWIGTGMFKTSIFPIPAGGERQVIIRYSQLLRKQDRMTDFIYPLSTARFTSQPVERLKMAIHVSSTTKIKNIYSPTHPIDIERPDDRHAKIKLEASQAVPSTDFRFFFDTEEQELGASLLSYRPQGNEDGYFLLLASPEVKSSDDSMPAKTVILTLDRSGSMSGKKLEQAKQSLRFVLNNLRDGDLFNIIAYDSLVEAFKPELQRFDNDSRKAAIGYIDSIYAGGSTNISEALSTALRQIQDDTRPNFIFFLTDGLPTAGETQELKISQSIQTQNKHRARIISLGVGYDVNSRLLDRLSRDNFGHSQFVRPDEDLEQHVSMVYRRMSQPVMTQIQLGIHVDPSNHDESAQVNRIYPKQVNDLFVGQQLVMVGRYRTGGSAKVTISGKVGQQTAELSFPCSLTNTSNDQSLSFIEKLWAMRRIGEIIDDLDLNGKNQELIDELVYLSTKHGILTPYTTFLADDTGSLRDLAASSTIRQQTEERLERLSASEGKLGVAQRAGKQMLQNAQAPGADYLGRGFGSAESLGVLGGSNSQLAQAGGASNLGGQIVLDIQADKPTVIQSVQTVGSITLYKRGRIWIAESIKEVDLEADAEQIRLIERFSPEYFEVVSQNKPDENALLARQLPGEELVVRLRNQIYRFQ